MGWEEELQERLLTTFVAEAVERLQAIDQVMLELERGCGPAEREGLLADAFRQAHTLKGGASVTGVPSVERIAHLLEDVLERVRSGTLPSDPSTFEAVYQAVDAMRAVVVAGPQGSDINVDAVVGRLDALAGRSTPAVPAGAGRSAQVVPLLAPRPQATALETRVPEPPAPELGDSIRIGVAKLDALMTQIGELHVSGSVLRRRITETRELERLVEQWEREDRVAGHLDRLSVLRQGLRGLRKSLEADVRRTTYAVAEAQDDVRRLRMVPVATAFAGLPRLVRDLGRACDKDVRLSVSGGEVEVDRSVLEELVGPLTHLVRNCVDHGIETRAARAAAGKAATGSVEVRAREERGSLTIDVVDDGAGIDVGRVRQRAVAAGVLEADAAAGLADHDVLQLVFRAGLSTSAAVSPLSGRGVGLDAVQKTVEALHGSVVLTSRPGAGTTFSLSLPLTVATTHCLFLAASGHRLAVPLSGVTRVVRPGPSEVGRQGGRETLVTPEGLVHVARLADVLGLATGNASGDAPSAHRPAAVVVQAGTARVALMVDEVLGEEEAVVKQLPPPLRRVRFAAGATILGTGEVVVVLNGSELVRATLRLGSGVTPVVRAAVAPADVAHYVLVVDDSITTRTMERTILENAGYRVGTAADGDEAWKRIQEGGVDAVVSDVRMPVMDGFALCARLRGDERYHHLPVVLVTSLDSRSDREQGLAAGADAYIVKGRFDQEDLLRALRRLLGP